LFLEPFSPKTSADGDEVHQPFHNLGVNVNKLFFSLSLTLGKNKLERFVPLKFFQGGKVGA